MTLQTSFLIRCRLVAGTDSNSAISYAIQHVQTGAEFRSASLEEITKWMTEQNLSYLAASTEQLTQTENDATGELGQ